MIATAAPFLSELKLRTGYSPFFRHIVTSAVLAALLLKFSGRLAPAYGVEATAWAATFLYLSFALARAAYIRTHCIGLGQPLDAPSLARSGFAFSRAFPQVKSRWLLVGSLVLCGAALIDVLLAGNRGGTAIATLAISAGLLAWFVWAPLLLLASGLWAMEGQFSLRRSWNLLKRHHHRVWLGWLIAVGVNALVSMAAITVLYPVLRTMVVSVLPSAKAVFFYSTAFVACLIAFQLSLQSAYAAWLAPLLVREEGPGKPIEDAAKGHVSVQRSIRWWLVRLAGLVFGLSVSVVASIAIALFGSYPQHVADGAGFQLEMITRRLILVLENRSYYEPMVVLKCSEADFAKPKPCDPILDRVTKVENVLRHTMRFIPFARCEHMERELVLLSKDHTRLRMLKGPDRSSDGYLAGAYDHKFDYPSRASQPLTLSLADVTRISVDCDKSVVVFEQTKR